MEIIGWIFLIIIIAIGLSLIGWILKLLWFVFSTIFGFISEGCLTTIAIIFIIIIICLLAA